MTPEQMQNLKVGDIVTNRYINTTYLVIHTEGLILAQQVLHITDSSEWELSRSASQPLAAGLQKLKAMIEDADRVMCRATGGQVSWKIVYNSLPGRDEFDTAFREAGYRLPNYYSDYSYEEDVRALMNAVREGWKQVTLTEGL